MTQANKIVISPSDLQKQWVSVAQVGRPHGIKGAFFVSTEDNRQEWNLGPKILVQLDANSFLDTSITRSFCAGQKLVFSIEGITDRSAIEPLYKKPIFVLLADLRKTVLSRNAVGEETFLVLDLVGCLVFENSVQIGTVASVGNFGAQDNLEIVLTNGSDSFFFPFTESFVKHVDVTSKQITVEGTSGFLP